MKLNTQKIRDAIKEKGLTIEQAAALMGITRQNLHMILLNQSTVLGRLEDIADPLGLSPTDILLREEE